MELIEIVVWPDGDWCYIEDLYEFSHRSDDYIVYSVYTNLTEEQIDELAYILVQGTYPYTNS